MFIDTHSHLNFKSFEKEGDLHYKNVIKRAQGAGVAHIIVPGTDDKTSKRAVEIASGNEGVSAAVGVHPHHVYQSQTSNHKSQINYKLQIEKGIHQLEDLIQLPKVVAVGEVGLDKHQYSITKYQNYTVTDDFLNNQIELFEAQIDLAIRHNKTLIVHNRETAKEMLSILSRKISFIKRAVFHCCEPKDELIQFAKKRHIFIGVDGDVTFIKEKQEFVKQIPLELLVLETDSPYLLPEPLKSQKKYPNEPANITYIASCLSSLKQVNEGIIQEATTKNAKSLFGI